MKNVKLFVLGAMSVVVALPILESLQELACVAIEIPKGLLSKKVIMINQELSAMQVSNDETDTVAIGFQAPKHDEYEEYDDDYDE